jgi:hypothetical protein
MGSQHKSQSWLANWWSVTTSGSIHLTISTAILAPEAEDQHCLELPTGLRDNETTALYLSMGNALLSLLMVINQ